MNYLFIFKNIFSFRFFSNFFKTILILLLAYNLPIYVFSNLVKLSPNYTINNLSYNIYNIFYKLPAFLFLYTYIGHKITKQINIITDKNNINPSHVYIFFLINISYLIFTLIGHSYKIGYYTLVLMDILTYSLYFSEFAYPFIDNSIYHYTNFVDFFNNNIFYFMILSAIYVLIDYYIIWNNLYLIGLFSYTVFISPILLCIKYNKYNPKSIPYYNIFYPIETILSFIVSLTSLILLDKLTKRNIQIK